MTAPGAEPLPQRFVGLDVLRGVAALSVVFWHWQHFSFDGLAAHKATPADLPLHAVFSLLYARGWMAVDLFFLLSGFIFFWLYEAPIRAGQVPAARFAWLRFSRLYPLHLATLLFVAVFGAGFVYAHHDLRHFALQLFFASSWGLEAGDSFNGPVWSVSVEVLVYALFFVWCRRMPPGICWRLAVGLVGLLALKALYPPLGRGIGGFFLGGWLYAMHARMQAGAAAQRWAKRFAWAAATGWLLTLAVHHSAWWPPKVLASLWPVLLFASTLLALSLNEPRWQPALRRWAWLGDISYASYLLHFPLQIAAVGAVAALGWPRTVFASPLALLGFMALLVAVAWACHRWFEMPAQRGLRGLWR